MNSQPNTPLQQSPYLREQRQFPNENLFELARQTDQAYIDIASKVNVRTIGIYAVNFPVITGDQWYLSGQPQKQQTLRQVYTFTSTTNIPHGLTFSTITLITRMYGQYMSGSRWFGLIPGTNAAPITGQISFFLTSTNIVFFVDGAAPALNKGVIVLEWLSQF